MGGNAPSTPPRTLAAMLGSAEGCGSAMVGRPGGSATVGAAVAAASARATTAASARAVAGAAGDFTATTGAAGCTGAAMVGAAVVVGVATGVAVALGIGTTSSFLLHPNDDSKTGIAAAATTATTRGAVFMDRESSPSPFRSARLSR